MSKRKTTGKKIKLIKLGKISDAPRWIDIKVFGLKRARSRRVRIDKKKPWRRSRHKI